MDFTIATMVRPFVGEFIEIQNNALRNWYELTDDIIMVGEREQGAWFAAQEFEARLIPCELNPEGVKLVNDAVKVIMESAVNEWILFTGAETLYDKCVGTAIETIEKSDLDGPVLVIGQRYDMYKDKPTMVLHPGYCIEYFLFRGDPWGELPDFAAGRPGYDNCLVWKALDIGVPVIDATSVIQARHQDHGSRHRTGKLAERNRQTMREKCGYAEVRHATYEMVKWEVVKK